MILVFNAGSSSIKVKLFGADLSPILAADVAGIGGTARLRLRDMSREVTAPDHHAALAVLMDALGVEGIAVRDLSAAGHRVVHGGESLTAPARLTPEVEAAIEACCPLAPLHNPHNLAAIRAVAALAPDLPQVACFDTAFHATNPAVATTYALPEAARTACIRRYGFHGLSYSGLAASFGAGLPARLLAFHLGNGASLCAMLQGRSVATSMGYSPLSGMVMGTRPGHVDGMAVLRLAEEYGIDGARDMLNNRSGLKALAGTNDMATLLGREDDAARFAVEMFCHWAAREAGSAVVAMGGLDAIAFTGGIGENAGTVRDRITAELAFLGEVPVHVVPADEERQIARETAALLHA